MSKLKFRRPSPGFILAAVALFVALGGGAYAGSKISTSDIEKQAVTSQKIKKEAVKTNKLYPGAVTNSKLDHPIYWAYVNPAGSLVRGNGVAIDSSGGGVTTIGTGHRVVQFDYNVSECVYVATGRYQEGDGRIVNAEADPSNGYRVRVRIRDGAGTATDGNSDFSLAVIC
jgi:hypothetical protein